MEPTGRVNVIAGEKTMERWSGEEDNLRAGVVSA